MATEPSKKGFWSFLFGKKDPEPIRTDATVATEEDRSPAPEIETQSAALHAEEPADVAPVSPVEEEAPAAVTKEEIVPAAEEKSTVLHRAVKRVKVSPSVPQMQKKAKCLVTQHKKRQDDNEPAKEAVLKKQEQKKEAKEAAAKTKEAPAQARKAVQPPTSAPEVKETPGTKPAPVTAPEEKKQGFFASLFSSKKNEPQKAPAPAAAAVSEKKEEQPAAEEHHARKSRIDFMRKRAKRPASETMEQPKDFFSETPRRQDMDWAHLRQEVPAPKPTLPANVAKPETKMPEKKVEKTPEVKRPTPVYPVTTGNMLESFGIKGLFLALLLLCLQTVPDILHSIKGTALFSPAEFANIKAYLSTAASGLWIAPVSSMPAQWPGFYWLSTALAHVVPNELLILTLSTLAGTALAVIATWILCRGAYGSTTATAASLILISTPLFTPVVHFYAPAALAGAFVLLAIFFFSRGWIGDGSWLSLPLAFICTAIAGLTGGLFHLLLPLITSFFFLIWCQRYRRAQRSDAIFGFLCFLAVIIGWFGYMYIVVKNGAYINNLLRSSFGSPLAISNWWLPFILLLAGTLPWLLALVFPSWLRVIATSFRSLRESRNENAPSTFIWFSLAVGIGLAVCLQKESQINAIICLLFIITPLLAKTVVRLSKFGARLFIFSCMLLLLAVGLLALLSYFSYAHEQLALFLPVMPPKEILSQLTTLKVLPVIGGVLLVAAIYLKTCLKRGDTGNLAITGAIVTTLLTFPVNMVLVRDISQHPLVQMKSLAQIKAPAAPAAPKAQATEAPKPAAPAAPKAQATEAPKPAAPAAPKAQATEAPKPAAPAAPKAQATEAPKPAAPAAPAAPKAPAAEAPKPAAPAAPATEAPKPAAPAAPATEAPKPAAPAAPKAQATEAPKPAAPKATQPVTPDTSK